jgi:hypothetical protein
MINQDIIRRYHEFRRIGPGGIVGECALYCLELARAEAWLDEQIAEERLAFVHEPDPDPDISWFGPHDRREYQADRLWIDMLAIVRYTGSGKPIYLACLGGVVVTPSRDSDDYVRLERANLAREVWRDRRNDTP